MRVSIIGYGGVAAVHARALAALNGVTIETICGPNQGRASQFAAAHGARRFTSEIADAAGSADAVIVCSPSALHYEQSLRALECGASTLVELPACTWPAEALDLARAAQAAGKTLQCAHTSRYLTPYRMIGAWLAGGRLGELRSVHYARSIPPRRRTWTDDALFHHAGHPLDLLLHWFGNLIPIGCAAQPHVPGAQDLALVARLSSGAPVSITISYTARLSGVRMTLAGADHTVATDGFSYIESDDPECDWRGEEQATYYHAIQEQDAAFLQACGSGTGGVSWEETLRLTSCAASFAQLWLDEKERLGHAAQ